jgi:hypothetical protein
MESWEMNEKRTSLWLTPFLILGSGTGSFALPQARYQMLR